LQRLPTDKEQPIKYGSPCRGDPRRSESTGAAGKRAAGEGRTPEAGVMHPTHGVLRARIARISAVF